MPGTAGKVERGANSCNSPAQGRPRLSADRLELMCLVEEGSRDFERARQLVDALVAEQVPFEESLLGGGPWQARLVAAEAARYLYTSHVLLPCLGRNFAAPRRWSSPAVPCCGRPGQRWGMC